MLHRRRFLAWLGGTALTASLGRATSGRAEAAMAGPERGTTLFLCGDVMTGRGVDQILPQSVAPQIFEPYLRDARDYVALAEQVNGPIPRGVAPGYVWGEALDELTRLAPAARIINLETAVTTHDDPWPKGINYRMHPTNVEVLKAAGVDCCSLANNHVLDWQQPGLAETLATLSQAGIASAGAGPDLARAQAPAVLPLAGGGRVLVFAFAERYSGVARDWVATANRPGIDLLPELSADTVSAIARRVAAHKGPRDIAVASIHWGGNWGYEIPAAQRSFAHGLIERAQIDVLHGHSSHHVKGIEVYRGRPVIYGCGDFINDYEGIRGHEGYRADLGLMYFPTLDRDSGELRRFVLSPTRIRRFRVQRASGGETAWLAEVLNREGGPFGTRVQTDAAGRLQLAW